MGPWTTLRKLGQKLGKLLHLRRWPPNGSDISGKRVSNNGLRRVDSSRLSRSGLRYDFLKEDMPEPRKIIFMCVIASILKYSII